jgi:hypothetical protein
MKPQTKAVARYLMRHGSITPKQAMDELGVWRLGARIYELRSQHGINVRSERVAVRTRDGETRIARYSV